MKIAIFTDSFYPTINGVVVSTICFINELTKLGHQIQVYCPHLKGVKNLTIENVEIIPLRGIPALFYPDFKFTTFSTPKVISKIKKFNPDIIHFHTQFVIGFKGIMVGKIFKIPIIGTYHTNISNEGYLKNIKMDNIEFIKKYAHKYNNLYYQNADLVLAPSVDSQDELIKDGIDNNKIKILFNPLPLEEKTDKKVFLKGVSGDIVLYVGRIAKEKNIEKAMEIFIEASKKRTNLKFVLVGDGPIKNKLENEIKEKGLENKIIFLGMIGHKDLVNSDIFEKSKIFLTASLSETFGITIIESLYFGVPVVGFK
ncbi:MAG: glycosyltransferase, partial [Candidatus Absconditabacteria bacterium]